MSFSVLPHAERLGVSPGRILIDGDWREGGAGEVWDHVHPATNEVVTTIAVATAADVAEAVGAARRAFDDGIWSGLRARDRQRLLQRVAALIDAHTDELNHLQTLDNGVPVGFTSVYQLSSTVAADVFDHHAGWVDKIAGQTLPDYTGSDWFPLTVREPVGVVSKVNFMDDGMFGSSALSSPDCSHVLQTSRAAVLARHEARGTRHGARGKDIRIQASGFRGGLI